jgi:hypothetical protein
VHSVTKVTHLNDPFKVIRSFAEVVYSVFIFMQVECSYEIKVLSKCLQHDRNSGVSFDSRGLNRHELSIAQSQ